jgi:predicted enzyme related to lactoylglutathione lyase
MMARRNVIRTRRQEVTMASRWYTVVIDAQDPARLARWWAQVLDYQVVYETSDEVGIAPDENTYPGIAFVAATQAKNGKNRIHLDLNPDDRDAEVERLVNMGARRVHPGHHDSASWIVLGDPEGNEFCILRPRDQ